MSGKRISGWNSIASLLNTHYLGVDIAANPESEKVLVSELLSFIVSELDLFVTVGIGGGYDYTDPSTAILDGKRNLKIMNEVTWGSNVDVVDEDIILQADELTIINFAVSNLQNIVIRANNINFTLSGTDYIFTNSSKLYLGYTCQFTGNDVEQNAVCNPSAPIVFAEKLIINLGDYGFKVGLGKVAILDLIGGGTNLLGDNILLFGRVDILNMSGTFNNWVHSNSKAVVALFANSMIDRINNTTTGGIQIRASNCVIKNANYVYIGIFATGFKIYDSYIKIISYYPTVNEIDVISNCEIDAINNLTGADNNLFNVQKLDNTIFNNGDLDISVDDTTITNCIVTAGTLNIEATADKTVITNPRTLTSIVDNGTNTQIIAPNLI